MKPKSFKNYRIKLVGSISIAALLGLAISYFGFHPPENYRIEKVPMDLKQRKKDSYNPEDFALMQIYINGQKSPICKVVSTTAVREYFSPAKGYEERTRVAAEVCQLPQGVSDLEVRVTFPYSLDDTSLTHNLDSCRNSRRTREGWQIDCDVSSNNKNSITLTGYEKAPQPSLIMPDLHQRNADRIDILLTK